MFLVLVLLVAALVAACGGAPTPEEVVTVVPTSAPAGDSTQPEGTPVVDATTEEPTAEPTSDGPQIAEDVPIIEGARDLQVSPDGGNISYIIDGMTIADVVAYYQVELEKFGWELGRAPDNVLPAMGTMARVNENGDRITFSLQYNPVGEFVVVRIVVLRSS
jgi:hypothetical protein